MLATVLPWARTCTPLERLHTRCRCAATLGLSFLQQTHLPGSLTRFSSLDFLFVFFGLLLD